MRHMPHIMMYIMTYATHNDAHHETHATHNDADPETHATHK